MCIPGEIKEGIHEGIREGESKNWIQEQEPRKAEGREGANNLKTLMQGYEVVTLVLRCTLYTVFV